MGRSPALAMPPGTDPRHLTRRLGRAHDAFVSDGSLDPSVRDVVLASWRRSVATGLDPERSVAPIRWDDARLAEARATHPLASAMPVIRRLLVDSATDAGMVVAVSDAAGRLLWVEGCPRLRSLAEGMHFMPGADWSEGVAGTNAPGTALALGAPVQIFGFEHLVRQVTPWSCSAAPIREPDTGAVLGVLDITGADEVAAPQTLALVRATVAAVEAELRLARLESRPRGPQAGGWQRPRLDLLGRRRARLAYGTTTTELSLRHSEMSLLLAESADGLTAGELAVLLSDDDQAQVTIRAELSRLRRQLGPVELGSRPYRLADVATDLDDVRADLAAGRLRRAVAHYRGPVLPPSEAPGVVAVRDDLHRRLRGALLDAGDPDALLSFADTGYARDDLEIWAAALTCLPAGSPRHTEVATYVAALDRDLR